MSSDLLNRLNGIVQSRLDQEVYGDASVGSVLPMVDLECGFGMDEKGRRTTLLVVEHCSPDYEHNVPEVVSIEMNGDRMLIPKPREADFCWVTEESAKIMRARFLLLKNYYHRRLNSMGHGMRQMVVSRFFPGGAWTPAAGSELSKAMGFESPDAPHEGEKGGESHG